MHEGGLPGGARRAELVRSLASLRARIAAACAPIGRDPRAITVIAVTKTFPAGDIVDLAALGIHDIGENRDQEARAKIAELGVTGAALGLRWHLVGRLQSNKARAVARYADCVHSVDRPALVDALDAAVHLAGRRALDVFVQVSLDGDPQRGGTCDVLPLADAIAATGGLALRGVMAVAPLGADADAAFARLAEISARVVAVHPAANAISAGMSADLEQAVRHGATHVRVGSALLGHRSPMVG